MPQVKEASSGVASVAVVSIYRLARSSLMYLNQPTCQIRHKVTSLAAKECATEQATRKLASIANVSIHRPAEEIQSVVLHNLGLDGVAVGQLPQQCAG